MIKDKLSFFSNRVQHELFPILENELSDPLLESHKKVAQILEILQVERLIPKKLPFERGRPQKSRALIARAYIAKHVLNISTIDHLIHILKCDKNLRYICGWNPGERVPSESTFSRAFAAFSETNIFDQIHQSLVEDFYENHIVLHSARDSMPIPVRERGETKSTKSKEFVRYPFQNEKKKKLTLCEYQETEAESIEEMTTHLNVKCDIGKKTNPRGISKVWRGYKLHMDVADGFFPISCIMTSASVHDSQAAIPLSKKSSMRADILYELMDSAYDVNAIKRYIQANERIPVVKVHKRRGKRKELEEQREMVNQVLNLSFPKDERLKSRFANERLFARLSDTFLCHSIRVRGVKKVFCHVMLGVLSLCASEITRFLC